MVRKLIDVLQVVPRNTEQLQLLRKFSIHSFLLLPTSRVLTLIVKVLVDEYLVIRRYRATGVLLPARGGIG